jgi:predicted DNA-binding transcriptional regulator AlpA
MQTPATVSQDLLTDKMLADRLRVSVHLVRRWRTQKRGPKFRKVGGTLVRYAAHEVEEWLASCPAGGGVAA